MPYTPTTPTLTLCDQLVAALVAAWEPVSPSGVERVYFKRIADAEDPNLKLVGRKVYVFPTHYDNGPEVRGRDEYLHDVSVLVVERYPDAGDPPTEWTDERVDFVYEYVVEGFDYSRDRASFNAHLVTLSANVMVCDIEKLTSGGKLFYSLTEIQFSESREA